MRAVLVALVFDPAFTEALEVLYERLPALVDQRPHDRAAARVNASQSSRAGAAKQPLQHGLRLIVPRMADSDDVGAKSDAGTLQERVARLARRLLERSAGPCGDGRDVAPLDVERQPAVGGQAPAELGVTLGRLAAQAMIQMRDAGQAEHAGRRQLGEHARQRHGIRAARHRGQHPRAVWKQRTPANRREHPSGQRSHGRPTTGPRLRTAG